MSTLEDVAARCSARRVRQGVETLADMDAAVLMRPDTADEVIDMVLSAWAWRTGVPISDRRAAARVAQRLLVSWAQTAGGVDKEGGSRWYDPYAPEDIFWQIGLMQDYELGEEQ